MLYTYHCLACDESWEEILPVSRRDDPTLDPCPECGAHRVTRPLQPSAFKLVPGPSGGWAGDGYTTRPS